jgi:hypothetical protein
VLELQVVGKLPGYETTLSLPKTIGRRWRAYRVATKTLFLRPFWESHYHHLRSFWLVQTLRLRSMAIQCTTMTLAPQMVSLSRRHNTRSLQHHLHVTRNLLALSVSRQRRHQCHLTHQGLHYRELHFEHDKLVHCRVDLQSPDTRVQTKATLDILTHFLLFESHPLHRHQRPLLSSKVPDLKICNRLVDLLHFHKRFAHSSAS